MKFTQTIFLPLFNPENVTNIPLQKVSFYQLKQCQVLQSLNQEIQSFPFALFSQLTTKHSNRYTLTVAKIIDLFMFCNTVAK
jgi:hypothetical protein